MDDIDTASSNTSIDDKTDDFCENPTRDTLAEGLMSLLKPTLDQLDERVKATRSSQLELKQQLDSLSEELSKISADQSCPVNLELYSTKLTNTRHKITVVSNILLAAQERLHKVQTQVNKELLKRNAGPPEGAAGSGSLQSTVATPVWVGREDVYEPSEDSFLLLDALEVDLPRIISSSPQIALEIGSGTGLAITALSLALPYTICLATDINPAACLATKDTSLRNSAKVEVVRTDLVKGLHLQMKVDLLVFNPPYVVTPEEEIAGDLPRSWAGGLNGRQVTDRLLQELPTLMSDKCNGYIVVIEENKPEEIKEILTEKGFSAKTVLKRTVPGEKLSIIRFSRTRISS